MNSARTNVESKRLNVLILDGGGVRGLSSLLILQALMLRINQSLKSLATDLGERHPQDVFQLVAGTSTGGLIAIMLGKLAMTVDECITQYKELSRTIFGKRHHRSRITGGLAPARYSGKRLQKCIQGLLSARQHDVDLSMTKRGDGIAWYVDRFLDLLLHSPRQKLSTDIRFPNLGTEYKKVTSAQFLPGRVVMKLSKLELGPFTNADAISAVVCREHCSDSQYSKLKHRAVPICSLKCEGNLDCTICEAARATSAAPTFFPVMKIGDRFFADGGLEHNNPSFAIYFHYTGEQRKKSTRPIGATTNSAPKFSPHGDLDCSRVRFTNIGTGAKEDEVNPGKREWLAGLVPGIIRKGVFLKQTLTEIAVNSAKNAEIMAQFEELNPNVIMYERFDADHGVSNIKLDDYKALPEIERRTKLYLEEQETIDLLEEVGNAIAKDYHNSLPIQAQDVAPSITLAASSLPTQAQDMAPSSTVTANSLPTQAEDMAPTNTVIDESHHQPGVPSLMPASSSLSTRPSSQSAHSEGGTHELSNYEQNGTTKLVESTEKAPLSLDKHDHVKLLVHDVSDTMGPIALPSAAPA